MREAARAIELEWGDAGITEIDEGTNFGEPKAIELWRLADEIEGILAGRQSVELADASAQKARRGRSI